MQTLTPSFSISVTLMHTPATPEVETATPSLHHVCPHIDNPTFVVFHYLVLMSFRLTLSLFWDLWEVGDELSLRIYGRVDFSITPTVEREESFSSDNVSNLLAWNVTEGRANVSSLYWCKHNPVDLTRCACSTCQP